MSETTPTIYTDKHCEGCMHTGSDNREDSQSLIFDGRPRASVWRPAAIKFIDADDEIPSRPCDISGPLGEMVLNAKARQVLEPYLAGYGELLPLKCNEGRYWAFNVTRLIDALDLHASDVVWGETGNILMINKHVFRPEALDGVLLFKIPQIRRGAIFFTDPFVQLIEGSGLTGLAFKRAWPQRPGDVRR
jgi:hypothetical protein